MNEPTVILKQADMSKEEIQERLDAIFEIIFEETLKVFDFSDGAKKE